MENLARDFNIIFYTFTAIVLLLSAACGFLFKLNYRHLDAFNKSQNELEAERKLRLKAENNLRAFKR